MSGRKPEGEGDAVCMGGIKLRRGMLALFIMVKNGGEYLDMVWK